MDTLTFQPVLRPALLTLVFVLAVAMLMIGPSFVKLPGKRRLTLALLRMGLIGLALLATLRPGCVQRIEKNQAAVLLFLIDETRSMQLPHVTDNSTRWGAVEEVIKDNQGRFKQLIDKKIDVRFFGFDNRVRPLEVEDGVVKLPKSPEGGETDIGSTLYETSLEVRDQRLLGVFLLSDGVQNVLDPEVELTAAADALNDMEVALYAVQLGLPGDTGQLADIAITNFAEQQIVNVKNDLTARATLVSRGYANQDIVVDLLLVDSAGQETKVKTEVVRPASNYAETEVRLKYRPTEPGEFRLKVRANPMPGELAIRNNELDAFLTVNDKGMRVLMLTGEIGNEQRFLRHSLPTADFIQLDFVPIFANTRSRWPLTEYEQLFKDPSYDVFILADLDSRALHDPRSYTRSLDALADAVFNGKGLLMIGGYHSFGPGLYSQTPLADVLPVKMNENERQDFGEDARRDLHINTPFKIRPAKDHFLTRLGDSENSRAIWKKLPALKGANRIVVKDNAEIILESDDDAARPVLAAANVGGRVLAFAGDSTWRWNLPEMPDGPLGFKAEYDQFWRQVVLWLAFWDAQNDETLSIELPQRRFQPYLSAAPPRCPHQVGLLPTSGQPCVSETVTEHVRMDVSDSRLGCSALEHQSHRCRSDRPPLPQPQLGLFGGPVPRSSPKVAVQLGDGASAHAHGAHAPAFPRHSQGSGVEVDVLNRDAGDLAQSYARVHQQDDHRGVAPGQEVLTRARLQQRPHVVVGRPWHGLLGDCRLLHPLHRVAVNLLLLDSPLEELLGRAEADGGRCRAAGVQQVVAHRSTPSRFGARDSCSRNPSSERREARYVCTVAVLMLRAWRLRRHEGRRCSSGRGMW